MKRIDLPDALVVVGIGATLLAFPTFLVAVFLLVALGVSIWIAAAVLACAILLFILGVFTVVGVVVLTPPDTYPPPVPSTFPCVCCGTSVPMPQEQSRSECNACGCSWYHDPVCGVCHEGCDHYRQKTGTLVSGY